MTSYDGSETFQAKANVSSYSYISKSFTPLSQKNC